MIALIAVLPLKGLNGKVTKALLKFLEFIKGWTISPKDAIVTLSNKFKLPIVDKIPAIDFATPWKEVPYLSK